MNNIISNILRAVSTTATTHLTPEVPADWAPSPVSPPFAHPAEIAASDAAVDELRKEATAYEAVMPSFAPSADLLAQKLEEGIALTKERRRAEAWLAYVSDHEHVSWRTTLGLLTEVRSAWSVAAREGLASAMPHLATLVGARTTSARKGVSTRVRRKKQKAVSTPTT